MSGDTSIELSQLPSIDRILNAREGKLMVAEFGRAEVKRQARETLQSMRAAVLAGVDIAVGEAIVIERMRSAFQQQRVRQVQAVYNLSGTILHTNLGRALLPPQAVDAAVAVMATASNLEYDLASGHRSDRDGYIEAQLCQLTGAEAATVVNNNAAAIMLVINSLALEREVPISRGELVEIGGSFRVAEIIARAGCRLVEVGSTNRTHLKDFEQALGPQTAMIMTVHQSNFFMGGFTASVAAEDLAGLCANAGIPLVTDLGSGSLVNLECYGLPHEQTPMDALNSGVDLVTFSGDKLLGGPQAGIIVGRRDLIEKINTNPMKRALRCDKVTIATLSSLLALYRHPQTLTDELPVLRLMTRDLRSIKDLARSLVKDLQKVMSRWVTVSLVDCDSQVGSGSLPELILPSAGVGLRPLPSCDGCEEMLERIVRAFRRLPTPVIGRIRRRQFVLDCRCLENAEGFREQLHALDLAE